MSDPLLVRQLSALSPKARLVAGVVLGISGGVACVVLWNRGWFAGIAVFAFVLGVALAWSARQELRRMRVVDLEMARARREWPDLARIVGQALREGGNVPRLLQERGYREFAVRRWIAGELRAVASSPDAGVVADDEVLPVSGAQLRALFQELDAASGDGYECDHAFTFTRGFLQRHGLPVAETLQWLGEHGAGCDCEVIFNVESQWGERVGFQPRDW